MPPTDGQQLAALGHEIAFADGSTARVRYSMRSFVQLEQRFGSLADAMAVFESMDGESAMHGPLFASMLDLLGCGLVDAGFVPHTRERVASVRTRHSDGRETTEDRREVVSVAYVRSSDRADLGSLVDFPDMERLMEAVGRAFEEAMPKPGEAPAPTMPGPPVDSLGRSSTTSRPLSLDVATTTSFV